MHVVDEAEASSVCYQKNFTQTSKYYYLNNFYPTCSHNRELAPRVVDNICRDDK